MFSDPDIQTALGALILAVIGWAADMFRRRTNDTRAASVMDKAVVAAVNLTPGATPGQPVPVGLVPAVMEQVATQIMRVAPEQAGRLVVDFVDRIIGRVTIADAPKDAIRGVLIQGAAKAAEILKR